MAYDWDTSHWEALHDTGAHGEAVTYTDREGTATAVSDAIWIESYAQSTEDARLGRRRADDEVCILRVSDVAAPEIDATLTRTATGESWKVAQVERLRGSRWRLSVQRARRMAPARGVDR